VHVINELEMQAPPEAVWAWLVRAARWPEWYPNSSNVQFLEKPSPDLQKDTVFAWRTFKVNLKSKVCEFVPGERLAWNGRGSGVWVYHAFLIKKTPTGCKVLTEESQYGWRCQLGKIFIPNNMHEKHQIWLERLACQAQTGPPLP
jgi:uncharacterized protein YndB with AHSA1/START domain